MEIGGKEMSAGRRHKDKNWLVYKYWVEGLSCREIGRSCGALAGTIHYWLKKYKIPIRTPSEAKMGNTNRLVGDI